MSGFTQYFSKIAGMETKQALMGAQLAECMKEEGMMSALAEKIGACQQHNVDVEELEK